MPKRLEPKKFRINGDCSQKCSLHITNLGEKTAAIVHGWYEQGLNDFKIEDNLREMDIKRSHGSIGRHRRNHLDVDDGTDGDEALEGLTDLEAIDLALARGQRNINNWKLTPSEYIKFMELKYRLTQGSTMDAMYAAMAAAGSAQDDDGETEDRPEGVADAGEGPSTVRGPLPVERTAPGPISMAPQLGVSDEHPRTGEPVGEDVRHRDEAHLGEHLQEGAEADEPAGVAPAPISVGIDRP